MPRIRTIKPEFFTSDTVSELSLRARLTWIGLWTYCDDYGRCRDNAKLIKAAVWALDDVTLRDIERDVLELQRAGLVQRYVVDGKNYMQVTSWSEHQKVSHPTASKIPEPSSGFSGPPPGRGVDPEGSSDYLDDSRDQPEFSGEILEASGAVLEGDGIFPPGKERKGTGNREGKRDVAPSRAAASSRPEVEALCEHLRNRIVANGSRTPAITNGWRDAARLMLDRDQRSLDQAHELIDWCQDHEFWRSNILGMPKFREKFDQLRLQRGQNGLRIASSDRNILDIQALKSRFPDSDPEPDMWRQLPGGSAS